MKKYHFIVLLLLILPTLNSPVNPEIVVNRDLDSWWLFDFNGNLLNESIDGYVLYPLHNGTKINTTLSIIDFRETGPEEGAVFTYYRDIASGYPIGSRYQYFDPIDPTKNHTATSVWTFNNYASPGSFIIDQTTRTINYQNDSITFLNELNNTFSLNIETPQDYVLIGGATVNAIKYNFIINTSRNEGWTTQFNEDHIKYTDVHRDGSSNWTIAYNNGTDILGSQPPVIGTFQNYTGFFSIDALNVVEEHYEIFTKDDLFSLYGIQTQSFEIDTRKLIDFYIGESEIITPTITVTKNVTITKTIMNVSTITETEVIINTQLKTITEQGTIITELATTTTTTEKTESSDASFNSFWLIPLLLIPLVFRKRK